MELDRVNKFLFEKVKLSIIQGKVTGVSSLPTDDEIKKEIDRILNSSKNGLIGSITPLVKKDVSSSKAYGNNFLTIKDNIEYILGEVYDSLNGIIDIVNDSILEKNQVLRDLKMIDRDFSDIEAGTLHNDGMKYVLSDSFADVDKIDMVRSTAQLNLNAGNVTLNTLNAAYLGFPHYRNQGAINFTVTEGFSKIVSQQQTPGTTFGSIFGGDDTDRWELVITTSSPITVEGYFALKLSEIGAAVEINAINMKLFSTKDLTNNSDMITIYYLNQDASDRTWKILPGAKIEVTGPEIGISFPTIKTSYIRVTWTKFYPDDEENLAYHFSITELTVQKATTVFESVLMSNSLKIQPYQNELPTIYVAELEVEKKVQPGTNLEFYVAIDDPIPGKILDDNNNMVGVDADNATSFVPNGIDENGKPENYFVFASELRDRPYLSGVFPYQYWQPKWQQISPKGDSIKSVPGQIFFNISDFDRPIHDLYYTNPILWGDPGYSGTWPTDPSYGWATDWSGNAGAFPKSGYIWGEDPLSEAGVWWGDSTEYPGWWRPSTPTSSGTYLSTPTVAVPDFNIPVYDMDGRPVREFNSYLGKDMPVQKHFWKIFKWPSTSLPIPGTVKISNKNLILNDEARDNVNVWKWNYKSTKIADDYLISDIELDPNVNFFTIKLDEYLTNRSDLRIIPDSIRNVKFLDVSPSEILDFTIEYGREYVLDDNGLYTSVASSPALADAHATIIFSDSAINQRRRGTTNKIRISLTLSYEAKDNISASWDGYLFVPSSVGDYLPKCHVDPGNGAVQKVTVQQISDTGLVQQTKEVTDTVGDNGDSTAGFSLFAGLNLVRAFTEVLVTQDDTIDSSIATWRPDQNTYTYSDGTFMEAYYIRPGDKGIAQTIIDNNYSYNTIVSNSINFNASGIYPGMEVAVVYYEYIENEYILSKEVNVIVSNVSELSDHTGNTYYQVKILPSTLSSKYFINHWKFSNFTRKTGFTYDKNISAQNEKRYLTEVDINILLNETGDTDDSRFAILDDVDGSKYVVIKTPNHKTFPQNIKNNLHYNRTYWDYLLGRYITYTTGTSGNVGSSPLVFKTNTDSKDPDSVAHTLSNMPPNTFNDQRYENVSTYGEMVNVVDPTTPGFLFWDTAENLQAVFDIKYSLAANNRPCDRVMLMTKLISTDLNMSPVLNSYSLIINNKMRGL